MSVVEGLETGAIEASGAGTPSLLLVSHHLCPYVQRAAISLAEKGVAFERISIDLASKPDWFTALSPLGKVPLLTVSMAGRRDTIFESAVILEYLEDTQPVPLHPQDPLERARHRSWIEFGSSILNRIAVFYNAETRTDLQGEAEKLSEMFAKLEAELTRGPWFAGERFSLVDAVYGPIFRYFDTFDGIDDFPVLNGKPRIAIWRHALGARESVRRAVSADYPERLLAFVRNRSSALGVLAAR